MKAPLITFLSIIIPYIFCLQAQETTHNSSSTQMNIREQRTFTNKQKIMVGKFKLINGDLAKAKYLFENIHSKKSKTINIKHHYLSIIAFIQEDYRAVLDHSDVGYLLYPHTCIIQVISKLALGRVQETKKEFIKCEYRTSNFTKTNHFWPRNLIQIKGNIQIKRSKIESESKKIKKGILNNRDFFYSLKKLDTDHLIESWFKLGMYAGLEKKLIQALSIVPEKTYKSERFNELIGLIYLRLGDYQKASKFIEGIETSNAYNIRGSIALEEKKYEFAYGYFSKALSIKSNSINAIERIIPLTWTLKKWDKGIGYLDKAELTGINKIGIQTLKAAFRMQNKKYLNAYDDLLLLDKYYLFNAPIEILQMKSILALVLNKGSDLDQLSHKLCKKNDAFNCWLQMQQMIWPDFIHQYNKTRKEESTKLIFTVDQLSKTSKINKLNDDTYINQKNIQELDEQELILKKILE